MTLSLVAAHVWRTAPMFGLIKDEHVKDRLRQFYRNDTLKTGIQSRLRNIMLCQGKIKLKIGYRCTTVIH